MSAPFVSVDGLRVAFGAAVAVDGLSMRVGRGEHVSLLGPSGCGKTTTLRALAGLETPSAGRIAIDGAPVFDAGAGLDLPPERRGLAMVFQSYAIWPHMSVFDNVAFSFRVRGIGRARARPAVERALALVDLARFADRPATKLSGGQQQRVALARALACDARVILLDEPLSNLDASLRVAMRAELADLRARIGFTAVYVTHDQEEAFALSDRIVVMRDGRVAQEGSPAELHAAPRSRFVASFLGVGNVLEAELEPATCGLLFARLAGGIVLRAQAPAGATRARGAIAFRPIDVVLRPAAEGAGGNAGTIVRKLFLGDLVHYVVRAGGVEIAARGRPSAALTEGTDVRWDVAPEHCRVLDD